MGRSPCCDKAAVKRGPWTAEEDARLRSYIQQHGTGGNWIALPRKVGLRRCGKSCRLRWLNYLRPDIRHGPFSDHEDRVICAIYAAVGSRWSLIAAQLPGRTDNDVKNYWNTRLKKRFFSNAGRPPPLQLHGAEDHYAPLLLHHHATTNHLHVATCTSSGNSIGAMHVADGCGGGTTSRTTSGTVAASQLGNDGVVFAAGQPTAATSYLSGVTTELDEIFRSTGTSGGEGPSAQSTDTMTMMDWYNQLQLQRELHHLQVGVQQQPILPPYY
ncbi:hypothetical protein ABZP36_011255 [Zizania latifolia]